MPIQPDSAWCAAHSLDAVALLPIDDLRRRPLREALQHFFELVDAFNCLFRDPAALTGRLKSLRGNPKVGEVRRHLQAILRDFYAKGLDIDFDEIGWDWELLGVEKYVLYLANEVTLHRRELLRLQRAELKKYMFQLIRFVNLLHELCDWTPDQLEGVTRETNVLTIFDMVHRIMGRLFPPAPTYTCEPDPSDWTFEEHRDYLLFLANEVVHRFNKRNLSIDAIDTLDRHGVIRGEFVYYVTQQREVFLRVLRHVGNRGHAYKVAIYAMMLALGYIAPWEEQETFQRISEEGRIPGGCGVPDARLGLLAHFVLHWQYGDAASAKVLEDRGVEILDLRLQRDIPGLENAPGFVTALLLSVLYAYFTPLPLSRGAQRGGLYCVGRGLMKRVLCACDTAGVPVPPGIEGRVPETLSRALVHSLGQMAEGLFHANGRLDEVFVRDFVELAGVNGGAALLLMGVAESSLRPMELYEKMSAALQSAALPEEVRTAWGQLLHDRIAAGATGETVRERVAESRAYVGDLLNRLQAAVREAEEEPSEGEEEEEDVGLLCDPEFLQEWYRTFCIQEADEGLPEALSPEARRAFEKQHSPTEFLDLVGDQLLHDYGLTAEQVGALKQAARAGEIDAGTYASKFRVAPEEAEHALEQLVKEDLLEKRTQEGRTSYTLSADVRF